MSTLPPDLSAGPRSLAKPEDVQYFEGGVLSSIGAVNTGVLPLREIMRMTMDAQPQLDDMEEQGRASLEPKTVISKFIGRTNLFFGVVALGTASDRGDPVKRTRREKRE